jgi:pathogenesis-related protein 1
MNGALTTKDTVRMKRFYQLTGLCTALVLTASACTAKEQLTPIEDEEALVHRAESLLDPVVMMATHNHWRSQVGAPALTWSEQLVHVSKNWAEYLKSYGCAAFHSNNGLGENIFQSTARIWQDGRREFVPRSTQEVAEKWGREMQYYNHAENSCSGECGHYTQIIWKDTQEMGCAVSVCDDQGQIWVCSYFPAGNIPGQRPY